ncbi:MAG: CHRD domain-containing protein [Saprospiraceae bacterium]|nr:CHRD domain-containing protein [Saprospiraceae bacterium]
MKTLSLLAIAFVSAVLIIGCGEEDLSELQSHAADRAIELQDRVDALSHNLHVPHRRNFTAHLSGDQEVPSVVTNATGQVILRFNKAGDALYYKLIVANIFNVRFSHLHMAPAGSNGGVVAFLYPGPTTSGRTQGVLAEGYITDGDVIGALAGQGLDALRTRIEVGNIYVNVHTDDNSPGEIRGQVK